MATKIRSSMRRRQGLPGSLGVAFELMFGSPEEMDAEDDAVIQLCGMPLAEAALGAMNVLIRVSGDDASYWANEGIALSLDGSQLDQSVVEVAEKYVFDRIESLTAWGKVSVARRVARYVAFCHGSEERKRNEQCVERTIATHEGQS